MCDLYLGATRATAPSTPFWANPSIQSSTYTFVRGSTYTIDVQLQNHDSTPTGTCSSATVNLYWSDPTTSFLILATHQLAAVGLSAMPVPQATTLPAADGSALFAFTWTPDATVVGGDPSDSGHVCLAAIAQSNSTDCIAPAPTLPGQTAATGSPLVAIHNVHVIDPPMGGIKPWPFVFGAANGGSIAGKTRLVARAYDPKIEEDRVRILALVAMPAVRAAVGRMAKFAVPAEVHLAVGRETVVVPHLVRAGQIAPRLGHTGVVAAEVVDDLVSRQWIKVPGGQSAIKEVELVPRQIQQAAIQVTPSSEQGHVYAVEVRHELVTSAAPVLLGGMTVVFVSATQPW